MNLRNLIDKIYLWQVAAFVAVALLTLGFTGEIHLFGDAQLLAGKGTLAIGYGAMFFIVACILRYIPPPEHSAVIERIERLERLVEHDKKNLPTES
jgi:hypothetical protein